MKDEVRVEQSLPATPSRVWKAITDLTEIKKWYFDLAEFRAETGFKFSFNGGPEGGPVYVHLCEITEVIPQKKLTYSWRYNGIPGMSFVTWKLDAEGGNTLLTLTHTGLESIAPAGPDFAINNFREGWNHFLNTALPAHIEAAGSGDMVSESR